MCARAAKGDGARGEGLWRMARGDGAATWAEARGEGRRRQAGRKPIEAGATRERGGRGWRAGRRGTVQQAGGGDGTQGPWARGETAERVPVID